MYFIVPIVAWFIAGMIKYTINYLRFGDEATSRIGNGGFPSNHTTIVTSITSVVGFSEGLTSPAFGLGVAVIMIVIFDATGLRRYVGHHATNINKMLSEGEAKLRESVGHTRVEVLGGLILGALVGYFSHLIL